MLFSAGAGLTGLRETLVAIDAEADGLWAPRRAAHRTYYQADDRLKEARRALREHSVTVADWRKLEQALERALHDRAALEREIEEKSAEQTRLGRIRRVYRDVRRSAELEEEIASLGGVKLIREDAVQILHDAERSDAEAAGRVETLTGQLGTARDERSRLTIDDELLLHEHDIEQIHERRISVQNAKADLPVRRAELTGAEADLRRLAAELEWQGDDLEQIMAWMPSRVRVNTVRTLLNGRGERLAALENTTAAVDDAARKLDELRTEIRKCEPVDVSKLRAAARAARALGDMVTRVGTAMAQGAEERSSRDRILHSLQLAVSDATVLAALPLPPWDTVVASREESRALDERIRRCRQHTQDATRELERQCAASERLVHDEEVVSPDELSDSRAHRDAGWSLVRRRYVDSVPVPEVEVGAFTGTDGNLAEALRGFRTCCRQARGSTLRQRGGCGAADPDPASNRGAGRTAEKPAR